MPTPNFHDLPDGSSIVNYAGHDFGPLEDIIYDAPIPAPPQPPPQTATQVNEAQRAARINPAWRAAPYPPGPFVQPERRPRARRLRESDPDAAIRKDPNAWSMREAVELCKLLEVVLPEAGFHIALTGGLLHKEGRQARCDLVFYQIREVQPNYEVLWKYLTVAGVIRSPSYLENGWLVRATYRGKFIDCLFPNARKAKKADGYKTIPVPEPFPVPIPPIGEGIASGIPAVERVTEAQRPSIPILYRRSPSAPVPYDAAMRDAADRVASAMAEVRSAEDERASRGFSEERVPGDFENPAAIPEPPF